MNMATKHDLGEPEEVFRFIDEGARRLADAKAAPPEQDAKIQAIQNFVAPEIADWISAEIAADSSHLRLVHDAAWTGFRDYCSEYGFEAVPANPWVVAAYLLIAFDGDTQSLIRVLTATRMVLITKGTLNDLTES